MRVREQPIRVQVSIKAYHSPLPNQTTGILIDPGTGDNCPTSWFCQSKLFVLFKTFLSFFLFGNTQFFHHLSLWQQSPHQPKLHFKSGICIHSTGIQCYCRQIIQIFLRKIWLMPTARHKRGSCWRAEHVLLPVWLWAVAQHWRLGCGYGGTPHVGAAMPPRCLPAQWLSTLVLLRCLLSYSLSPSRHADT